MGKCLENVKEIDNARWCFLEHSIVSGTKQFHYMIIEPSLLSVPPVLGHSLPEGGLFCFVLGGLVFSWRDLLIIFPFASFAGHRALSHQNIFITQWSKPSVSSLSALPLLFQTLPWQTNIK